MIDQLEDYKLDSPIFTKVVLKLGMVVHACNPSTKEWKQEDQFKIFVNLWGSRSA